DQLVGEQAAFALLQFTMRRLWSVRARNRITWAAVRDAGVGRVAIVRAAQTFYGGLSDAQRTLLRPLLVRLSAGPQPASVPWDALLQTTDDPNATAQLLDVVAQASLISVSLRPTGEKTVKLAHVSLAEQWDTLAGWLHEERGQLARQRRLGARAREGGRLGRPKNAALLGGLEWREAQGWLDSRAGQRMGASQDVRAFIATSRWRRRRNQRYLRLAAAAFAGIAALATCGWILTGYEWHLANRR